MGKILWLSGPTGSGKSSLASLMERYGFASVKEQIPRQLFDAFRANPPRYCADLQKEIMTSRYSQWSNLRDRSTVVFDRSLDEDIMIFCAMHRRNSLLTDLEFDCLENLYRKYIDQMPRPDMIVYLRPRLEILLGRMVAEGHPELLVNHLEMQVTIYDDWIATKHEPKLRLDNSDCSLDGFVNALVN